ncbi:MAG TPA: hypothetical protein VNN10_11950 [Dehalococcoidia bacterium]|nr:hypothetical protein [Dehalococcoidia bacterium]
MMQEIGLAMVAIGGAGVLAVAATSALQALRRGRAEPAVIRIDRRRLAPRADLTPGGTSHRPPDPAPPALADELFSELFALRAEVAALTEDVRSMRRQLEAGRPEGVLGGQLAEQPPAAA